MERTRKNLRLLGKTASYCFIFILSLFVPANTKQAYADVGVVLNGALDSGIARITASGHSAVYLSRICPASPIKMRLCGPGENGSVISNYENFAEDQHFEWNIVPLNVFIYGVANVKERPLFGSEKIKAVLEENYREGYLSDYCGEAHCITDKNANWRDMVGEDLARNIYIFVAKTTLQQDLALIAEFNSLPNEDHFNGFTRNCADFTRELVNRYFPGAAHRDYLNDFGMTSPKSVAKDFARYAERHPEEEYRVMHFSQLPGTMKRSSDPRDGTEQLYHSKKLLTPLLYLSPHAVPVLAASYLIWGRFNPEHEFEKNPSSETVDQAYEQSGYQPRRDSSGIKYVSLKRTVPDPAVGPANILGTQDGWSEYREEYNRIVDEAVHEGVISSRNSLRRAFKRIQRQGVPVADRSGSIWMNVPNADGTTSRVGLSANTLLANGSDPQLAYTLILARVGRELKGREEDRETMQEFVGDWQLLVRARARAIPDRQIQMASEK